RRLDAVVAVAEIDRVQIRGENLRLAVTLLEPYGDRRLADLALDGARRRQLLEPRQLLRDGAAAFDDPSRAPVAPRRLDDAHGVEPMVIVEAAILDGEKRV